MPDKFDDMAKWGENIRKGDQMSSRSTHII